MIAQIISTLAVLAASVAAVENKHRRCAPKHCKGINCLETLARINFEPKWCGAELMEKLARRAILRPDVNWAWNSFDPATSNPCDYLITQDPSVGVALVNSNAEVICAAGAVTPEYTALSTDYSYIVHSSWSTNHVKYVNYDGKTFVAVPLYFRDGTVRVAVFAKLNTELPIVCCENPDPTLTQCRRFN